MANPQTQPPISVEVYLEGEKHSDIRHEYLAGQVYAMVGASIRHNLLAGNLFTALRQATHGSPCQVFMSDVKLRIDSAGETYFYYPDIMVCCDPNDRERYWRTRPKLIVEVLSESTERIDRREKRLAHIQLEGLDDYLLVEQESPALTLYSRASGWKPQRLEAGDSLSLPDIGLKLPVAEIYSDNIPDGSET